MSIASFAVRQPVLVNLIALMFVVSGVMSFQRINREALPMMPTGWAMVATAYPGAAPEEVEKLITTPLEQAIKNVDGIENLRSRSSESSSAIYIEFEASVEDVARKVMEVTNEVASVPDLPLDAEPSVVREFVVESPTLAVAVRGDISEAMLRELATNIADDLEQVPGVQGIWRQGIRQREIRVEVDPNVLTAYPISITDVANALSRRGSNMPAGVTRGNDPRLVRTMTEAPDAASVGNVAIRATPGTLPIRVRDVATVTDGYAPGELSGRINGESGVALTLYKDEQADSIRISEHVKRYLTELRPNLPKGVTVDVYGDSSFEVQNSLSELYKNAIVGLLLVLALLWWAIGARNAAMAALGLPVALAGAIATMHMMGITLNVISLLALILCLGIVVDDSIIIIENIYRHMEEGLSPTQSAIIGAQEVFWPVVSSTATTCAAFLPLLLMTGTLGMFFAIIPKVVVASLSASLIEAMVVLPSHMADFGKLSQDAKSKRPDEPSRADRGLERFVDGYERLLRRALGHRVLVIVGSFAVCGALAFATLSTLDIVLFNDGDVDRFEVRVRMPADTSAEQTERMLNEIDKQIAALRNPDIEATVATRGMARTSSGVDRGDHTGTIFVYVKPLAARSSAQGGAELMRAVEKLLNDVVGPESVEVEPTRSGPPRGAPVAVRVIGDNLTTLINIADEIRAKVLALPGVKHTRHDFEDGRQEVRVYVDEDRASIHGLTAIQVGDWLRSAIGAVPVATLRDGTDEIDIVVTVPDAIQRDPDEIAKLRITTPTGGHVAIADIADVAYGRGVGAIRHFDATRVVTVFAFIDEDVTNATEVNTTLSNDIASIRAEHPGVRFELGGQFEDTNESVASLKQAFVIAALLIFTILATQFQSFIQPFVVMSAIPLSLIGVLSGFLIKGEPIGVIALVGVVGLAGIVVNDSLVLVDFINKRRRTGTPLDEAIVVGSKLRLRPILLTSITTIAGLFPLALAGESAATLSPMAEAMVWGLTLSTVLTLIVVPCLYRTMAGADPAPHAV